MGLLYISLINCCYMYDLIGSLNNRMPQHGFVHIQMYKITETDMDSGWETKLEADPEFLRIALCAVCTKF